MYDNLPTDTHHGWKYLAFGPDGFLYFQVSAPCNICNKEEEDERFASILRLNPDGGEPEIYAHGIRNSVGMDWHPQTDELWFTDNGRDWLGDDLPPCELNRAPRRGMHFGYPFCHGSDIADKDYGHLRSCDELEPPVQNLDAHVAPLGMLFYTGNMFPAAYKNQVFICEHGSWNRSAKSGYRLTLVRLDETGKSTSYEPFATGFLSEKEKVLGRPVDLLQLTDGSLLISDDFANAVYRLSYKEQH